MDNENNNDRWVFDGKYFVKVKRCLLCGLPSHTDKLCENCQYALFQIRELKDCLTEALREGKMPPDWALKAAEKITETLADYPYFLAYKKVISEIVWYYIIDDESLYNGIEIEEVTELEYTHRSRDQILRDLYELEIIDISLDRRIFPGKMLKSLLDLKKIYGDNFASFNWKSYTLAIQAIFMLGIVEKLLEKHIKENTPLPRIPLVTFKILSAVIQKYKDKTDELDRINEFRLLDIELQALISILGSKVSKNRFYINITGIKDSNAKLIEDFDEKEKEFIIHKDLNNYIKRMIERIRDVERERKR